MSNELDNGLRPHLSALVDGELEPLEAIALQRHLRHRPALASEYRELEALKLSVHLAGRREEPAPELRQRLLARIRIETAAVDLRRRRRRWVVPAAAAAMAAALLVFALAPWASSDAGSVGEGAVTEYKLTGSTLNRLIAIHTGELPPMALRDMRLSGALLSLEQLPGGFIDEGGARRSGVVRTSYEACSERAAGATMAVLRADRIDLPPNITAALEGSGVYEDEIDGVSIRLSAHGDRLFVLLDGQADLSSDPI